MLTEMADVFTREAAIDISLSERVTNMRRAIAFLSYVLRRSACVQIILAFKNIDTDEKNSFFGLELIPDFGYRQGNRLQTIGPPCNPHACVKDTPLIRGLTLLCYQ